MHIQHVMLCVFKNNKNTTETVKKISCAYGFTGHHVQIWFSKFHSGEISLRDKLGPGCSSDLDQSALRELVENSILKYLRFSS